MGKNSKKLNQNSNRVSLLRKVPTIKGKRMMSSIMKQIKGVSPFNPKKFDLKDSSND